MTETPDASAAPVAPDSGSFFGNLFNLYFEPTATFAKIFTKPRLVGIFLLQIALGVAFSSIWAQKVDMREFMRQQMEQNPRTQEMPAEQVDRILDAQVNFFKNWGRMIPWIAPIVLDLILAGIFMFVFRFFMAADLTYARALTTVVWSFVAVSVLLTPIMLAVYSLKGDWNVDPNQIVQANAAVFLEQASTARWLWTLLSSFDLFSLWTAFLFATGFAVASRRDFSSGVWGVGVPWVLYIALKVAAILVFA